jgi:integrase
MALSELDGALWTIPAERMKNGRPHQLRLPPMALEQLGDGDGYVFSTTGGSKPVSGFSKMKARLDAAAPGMAPWRLHDLRRTAATGMARAGADVHVIERALSHVTGSLGGVAGIYNRHRYEQQVADALAAWSNMVGELLGVMPGNVVHIAL